MDGDTLLDQASLLLRDFKEFSSRYGAPVKAPGASDSALVAYQQTTPRSFRKGSSAPKGERSADTNMQYLVEEDNAEAGGLWSSSCSCNLA